MRKSITKPRQKELQKCIDKIRDILNEQISERKEDYQSRSDVWKRSPNGIDHEYETCEINLCVIMLKHFEDDL